ncbi:zinc knuckle CX2CX4HX4C containing protein [Tanacetum coccineum]
MIHVAGPSMKGKLQSDVKKDKRPVQATDNKGKRFQIVSTFYIKGYRVNVPKSKFVYRAVVKPQDVSNVTSNMEKSLDTTTKPSPSDSSKGGTSFSNDDISLAELRTFVDKSMQEESVLEYVGLNDIKGCTSRGKLDEKVSCKKSRSSMEVINEDSDTDVDEDFVPNDGNTFPCSSSGGGGHSLEEDAYDDYEVQFEEYPSDYQEFCDQFDFKVKGLGEDCTLADVIIPQEEVDTLSARFENSLYGYFVRRRLAFPVEGMENVLDQGPWRIRSVPLILNVWNPISELKREDIKKVPVWVKLFNVPVVAYSKVGLNLITAKLGRLIKFDAHTSNMCLNSWGMNSYARVLVEISAEKELVQSLVVAVPIDKNKGHRLVSIEIEFEYRPPRCSVCKVFDHIDKECHKKEKEEIQNTNKEDGLGYDKRKSKGINQASKANNTSRFRFSKGKPKLIYRPVVKPTNTMLSPSKPKDSSSHYSKEAVNVACDKPTEPSNVTTDDSSRPTNENAKSKFIQDDIDLGQLRSYIDKRMEEDKVIDLNTDVVVSTNNSYAPEKDNGSKKVSFLEKFLKTREASKNKHHSLSDSEESEVEEVCMPDHISGGGSLDRLEDDLDGYDGYEAQFCDLNEQGQVFCDQYNIHLNSRRRKSFS